MYRNDLEMGISEQLSLETLFADVQRMDKRQVIHMQSTYLYVVDTAVPDGAITSPIALEKLLSPS